jgi:single-strand selective monofunctional uracil DNA glycosylase
VKQLTSQELIRAAETLRDAVNQLTFGPPVAYVYNPLLYAWRSHQEYLDRYGESPKRVVFLGMNPGPFGMAQTGVPFGEIDAVRGWMSIEQPIHSPSRTHPKRPIQGFACKRSEVSGRRLWGLFARRFETAEEFFREHFVANYCPLAFLEKSGCNRTPDKLPAQESAALQSVCDEHLRRMLEILQPQWLVGVGQFAAERARLAGVPSTVQVGTILHPSPANPASNRDWEGTAVRQLQRLGVWK